MLFTIATTTFLVSLLLFFLYLSSSTILAFLVFLFITIVLTILYIFFIISLSFSRSYLVTYLTPSSIT